MRKEKPVTAAIEKLKQIEREMPAPLTPNDSRLLLDYIAGLERVATGVIQNYRIGKPSPSKLTDMATGVLYKTAPNDAWYEVK